MSDLFSQFGVDPAKLAVQISLWLIPAIWASARVIRHRSGEAVPLWLLFIWMVPVIGAVVALVAVRRVELSES